jgi:hypothetical protein
VPETRRRSVARVTFTNPRFEWDIANSAGPQSAVRGVALRGAYIGRALALQHFVLGELHRGINTEPDRARRGKYPVLDWLVVFSHEAMEALEYGHMLSGAWAGGKKRRREGPSAFVPGIHIVGKTLKSLGG